jgi:proline-specific peptidase
VTRAGFVEHARGRTWYRVAGDPAAGRDPLLCLHGGPGSTHHYFAPLERLAGDRAVVLYDQLGCGSSSRPDDVDWSLGVFLDELDALRAALGLERVHLLGTSWGGMLALEHALARPGTVRSLLLSSTLASAEEWAAEALRLRDELPEAAREALERHERAGTTEGPEYVRAMEPFDRRHFHRLDPPAPEIERMLGERAPAVYRAMWGPNEWTITGALGGWDVRPRLCELDVPTLVLRGAFDLCSPAIARTLVDGIAGAREVLFERSSHTPVVEEPEAYVAAVRSFLAEVESP